MVAVSNALEGTNGAAITNANTGGPNQFTAVTKTGTGATSTFDSTRAHSGTTSLKHHVGTVSSTVYEDWGSAALGTGLTNGYSRFYVYLTARNTAICRMVALIGSTALRGSMQMNTNGTLRIINSPGTVLATTTAAVPLNTWVRIEFEVTGISGTTGTVSARFFSGANLEGTTPDTNSSVSVSGTNVGGTIDTMRLGQSSGTTQTTAWDIWYDDVAFDSVSQPGSSVAGTFGSLPRVTESSTAQALAGPKVGAISGAVVEADSPRTVTGTSIGALPSTSTTDTARTLTGLTAASGAIPRVTEASVSATLSAAKAGSLPTGAQSDAARPLSAAWAGSAPRVTESDGAPAVTATKTGAMPRATSADTAGSLTAIKVATFPTASTAESARTITGQTTVVGLYPRVTEGSSVFASGAKAGTHPRVTETDGALAATGASTGVFPRVTEAQTARGLGSLSGAQIPGVVETDVPRPVSASKVGTLPAVGTTGTARPLTASRAGTLPAPVETDSARPLTGVITVGGALPKATESDAARALVGNYAAPLARVDETDTPRQPTGASAGALPKATTAEGTGSLGRAISLPELLEAQEAGALTALKDGSIPGVLEVDSAGVFTIPVVAVIPVVRTLTSLSRSNVLVPLTTADDLTVPVVVDRLESLTEPNSLVALARVATLSTTT